ncbi:MAG: class I adenylate-forming enzyme family protein [Coriobacteriales bacterium]|nr:class I adenylate-forming enzyme family protein [Coriobacteriales bacterium]
MSENHIIVELLESSVAKYPDYAAVRWTEKRKVQERSYRELNADKNKVTSALLKRGFEGKQVAMIGTSAYEWIATWLGIVSGKMTAVPLDPVLPALELCDLINRSDSEALFVSPKMKAIIEVVQENCPAVRLFVILSDKPVPEGSPAISFADFIAEESGDELPADTRPEADDVSTIIFTSGTTGKPKGVMLTQRNMYDDVENVIVTFDPGTSMLSVLPIHHAYCLVMDWLKGFSTGASIFINDTLLHMMRNIRNVQPQIMLMVPLMIETIGKRLAEVDVDAPKEVIAKQVLGENLEYIFSGGAHLDPSYIDLFESYGIKVCEGYGMSECSPTISTNGENGNRPGSVGKLLANMQVRFVDGEIQVKGSNVMKGYYKMPKETEEAFSDGWLRTGDLGRMDEDGYLYITGRLKNLIIASNGENISPEEIENALLSNGLVGEVVIAGEDNGLSARIFPDPEYVEAQELGPEEIAAQLQEILDAYNKTQPTYRAITALTIRKFPFIKNSTKKIVRAKMDIDEDPEAAL